VHNAADNAAIVHPLDTPDIRRQVTFNSFPSCSSFSQNTDARSQSSFQETNQDRILSAKKLMSSHPNPHIIVGAQQATLAGNSGGLRFR
jgi:hypothetical protein